MRLQFQLPKFKLYLAPTSQSSWSSRPFHVSLSSSLWTDLLMVAILFRLNEFTLSHLTPGLSGFWLPTTVFFAVYDVWETRVLFDSVFKFQDDLFHHFIGILQWLLLALMATSITPDKTWSAFDSLLFSGLKLAHQTIRVFNYWETWRYSHSKRARRSARARSFMYVLSWPLYLAVPCLLSNDSSSYGMDAACGLWVVGFFFQRILWALLKWDPFPNPLVPFRQDCAMIKTNIPFKTTRYGDWTMLQLGAIVLGFMTVPIGTVAAYGTLVCGYVFVGCLNMFAYSINPQDAAQHALVRGGVLEFVWLELYSLAGLCFMAVAVGLRVHLFYPQQVVLPQFRHYTWLLCVCAQMATLAMFAQELCHGGLLLRTNEGKVVWYKLLASTLYTVTAAVFVGTGAKEPVLVVLGMMLSSVLVLVIQVANGAFKRRYFKTERRKLLGHFRAAVVAMVWLHRARRNLREMGREDCISHKTTTTLTATTTASTSTDDDVTVFQQHHPNKNNHKRLSQVVANLRGSLVDQAIPTGVTVLKPSPQQLAAQSARLRPGNAPQAKFSADDHANNRYSVRLPLNKLSGMLPSSSAGDSSLRSSLHRPHHRLSLAKQEMRQWKIVLNDKFYSPPRVFVEGNKATKYRVQWSDLFFDVLFVGAVFRLGDLLLSGMGAGYSESSVHFLQDVLESGPVPLYEDPIYDPARSDAVGVFLTVFLAVWALWQNRLAYGSKVGSGDVVHKIVDLAQGLAVMLIAVNITTRERMADSSSGNAYAVAAGLVAFQSSMVLLWVELLLLSPDSQQSGKAKGTATRNLHRDSASLVPLLLSFCTIHYQASLMATTALWALSWAIPFALRVLAVRSMNDGNAVRDLHRYVIHRLGDGALIVLGEGVLQIIRAKVLVKSLYFFLAVLLGLFGVTAVRIAVWSMDCFSDSSKHAQLLSLRAGLAAYLVRSLAAPALVAVGVAMKKMVSSSYTNDFHWDYHSFYWLLCGASFAACVTQIVTYELHRVAFHHRFRRAEPALMLCMACLFLVWPAVLLPSWVTQLLCLGTWLAIVLVHFLLDDYFLLKEQRSKAETEAALFARTASMKSLNKQRKRGILAHALSAGSFLRGGSKPPLSSSSPLTLFKSSRHVHQSDFDRPVVGEKKFNPSHLPLVMSEERSLVNNNPLYDDEPTVFTAHFAEPSLGPDGAPRDSLVIVPQPPFVPRLNVPSFT